MKSFGSTMAVLSVAVLTAGLIWPHLALTLLQALVVTLALAYVGARVQASSLPAGLATDLYSPFDIVASAPTPSASLPSIRDLAVLLQASEDPEAARLAPIPAVARRIIAAEASRRLAEHHRLSLHRLGDHERVRALLSDATWSLLLAGATRVRGRSAEDFVPMDLLETILGDVENL